MLMQAPTRIQITQPPGKAPTVKFDLASDFVGLDLLRFMCWPNDSAKRDEALVTWAGQLMGIAKKDIPGVIDRAIEDALVEAAITEPVPLAQRQGLEETRKQPAALEQKIRDELFEPAGSWDAIARAGGAP